MDNLLIALENNARLSDRQLAAMLGKSEGEVRAAIEAYEHDGTIMSYQTLINWDKTDRDLCHARIEIRVIPKSGLGFDDIAEKLMQYDQVETVYLMSGTYDLALTVRGKTFKDVAMFVSQCLAPLDSVQSTTTHFVLKKYKERGRAAQGKEVDTREGFNL